jgi:DNA-binding transcriptional ArsR family regulator
MRLNVPMGVPISRCGLAPAAALRCVEGLGPIAGHDGSGAVGDSRTGGQRFSGVRPGPAEAAAGLEALLGEPRAGLLRRLDRPVTAGMLAEALMYGPSGISHHLLTLEWAGLLERQRSGRHILVHRTTLGSALIDLYDRCAERAPEGYEDCWPR